MKRAIAHVAPIIILLALTTIGVAITPLAPLPAGSQQGTSGTFAEFMEPRLAALLASSKTVEGMVTERSRNVLALRAESERINALIEEIDAWLDGRKLTPSEQTAATSYRNGAARIQAAITAAYDAISSFDFSAMPRMIPIFSDGTDHIENALAAIRTEDDNGSSYTVDNAFG